MPYNNRFSISLGQSIPLFNIPNWYYKFKQLKFALRFVNILKKTLEMPFYAVAVGKVPGVYNTWEECQAQTKGFSKPKFRKFNTKAEADEFVHSNGLVTFGNTFEAPASSFNRVENRNPSKLIDVSTTVSLSMLKKDKLSLIAEKLDKFIEDTNKRLDEFGNRLEVLEALSPIGSINFLESKRKSESNESLKSGKKKNKKSPEVTIEVSSGEDDSEDLPVNNTRRSTRGKSGGSADVEVVDGPWGVQLNTSKAGFRTTADGFVVVYTDGACSQNGKVGAKAGVGVWFNHNNPFNVSAPVVGVATNNNAEIQAATRAIEQAQLAGVTRLNIHTDSQFLINCITDWINKWKRNNWMTLQGVAVKNKEQLVILDDAMQSMEAIRWTHVRGHHGNEGNECADDLARKGAKMYR